jgi:hypothetical protein
VTAGALVLLAAFSVAAVALARARLGIGSVRVQLFAPPRGSAAAGVRYAFTAAFLPWEKESARGHLPTYLAGIVYHAGIFVMLALLVLALVPVTLPHPAALALAALCGLACAGGLGLLVKRRFSPALRAISVPDDLIANLLVDLALASAAVSLLEPGALPLFQGAGAALLLYAPLGKLRHMLFLLTSRRLWGEFYGRRGVRG